MINLEAEDLFIGCLLKNGELIKKTNIQPNQLYDPANKKTLEIMRTLEEKNEVIDIVSIITASDGQADKERLAKLVNSVPSTESFDFTQKQVLKSYKISEADRIKSKEIKSLKDISKLQVELSEISTSLDDNDYDHKQSMIDLYDSIEHQKEGLSGYDTGFKDLNRMLDGFQEGNLIISAARPSMG